MDSAKPIVGQAAQILFARRAGLQHRVLGEFENDLAGQVAIGLHVIQELREEFGVGQRVAGDVAEDADLAALLRQAPHDLDAAEQQQIVHHAHQPGWRRHLDILGRHDHRAVLGAQPRQRLVIAQLALRQADDGLQVQIDAVFFQAGADGLQQFVLSSPRVAT